MKSTFPPSAWMYKPRSKTTEARNSAIGSASGANNTGTVATNTQNSGRLLSSAQSMFGNLRNTLSTHTWNRRYVGVDATSFYYGASIGNKERVIALETIRSVGTASRELMRAEKAPEHFVDFGWKLVVAGKEILLCCEDESTRDDYVQHLSGVLQRMSEGTGAHSSEAANTAAGGATSSAQFLHDNHNAGGGEWTTSAMIARATAAAAAAPSSSSVASPTAADSAANVDWNEYQVPVRRGTIMDPETSSVAHTATGGGGGGATAGGFDDDDDTQSVAPRVTGKSQQELRKLVGADDDDQVDFNDLDWKDNMEFDDDDLASDEEEGGGGGRAGENGDDAEDDGPPVISVDEQLRRIFVPIAATSHSHIQFKMKNYAHLLNKDDSLANILFSREVEKVGRNDKPERRDLLVTTKAIYLIADKGVLRGLSVRSFELDQLVCVVESTIESDLVALMFPHFHDLLIRIVNQQSLVGGSRLDVKRQLLAHLYCAHRKLNTGRPLRFREVENVRAVIRRSITDPHLPLASRAGDTLRCATAKDLYTIFRINADSVIHWSSLVSRLNAEGKTTVRAFVVSDGGFYFASSNLKEVLRRTAFSEVTKVMYDVDLLWILIKCVEVDALFVARDASDFHQIRQLFLEVASESGAKHIRAIPSKQLTQYAQLIEVRKLREKFGENTDGLKQQLKVAQTMFRRGVTKSLQSVGFVTNQVVNIGEKSVDLLKNAGKGVGDVLVDNQVTGGLIGVLGAAGLTTGPRFLMESIISYDDEEMILHAAEPFTDQLQIARMPQAADLKLGGTVGYSSRCGLFNLAATISLDKTADRLIVVSPAGITLIHPPEESFSLLNPIRGILAHLAHGLSVDTVVEWTSIIGIVQCSNDDNVVGLLTNNSRHIDLMFRLPNAVMMTKFVATASLFYMRSQTGGSNQRFVRNMVGLYHVPRVDNVRLALKKVIFEVPPMIALRTTPTNGDVRQLALSPVVATRCRSHGDNTIYFSGLGWRFRSTSTKKGSGTMREILKDESEKGNNKLFKSFVLVLTNCAIYEMTKGSPQVIHRRTELRDIAKLVLAKDDPNTMLLQVPKEYDWLIRIDGRGQEFKDRLMEAYTTHWTRIGWYLPNEAPDSHNPQQYFVPVVTHEDLVSVGKLEKPPNFTQAQMERDAADVNLHYVAWHKRELSDVLNRFTKAADAAARGVVFDPSSVPGYNPMSGIAAQFRDIFYGLQVLVSEVRFVHARAYRFGLRATGMSDMVQAQKVLMTWSEACIILDEMQQAVAEENIELYEERFDDVSGIPMFQVLAREQEGVFETLRQKKMALLRITEILDDSRPVAEQTSLSDVQAELAEAFEAAVSVGVKPQLLQALRRKLDKKAQRERLTRHLAKLAMAGDLEGLPVAEKYLIREAAVRLDVDKHALEVAFGAGAVNQRRGTVMLQSGKSDDNMTLNINLKSFNSALRHAINLGEQKLLLDVLERASKALESARSKHDELNASVTTTVDALAETLAYAQKQLAILQQHADVQREIDTRRLQLKHFQAKREVHHSTSSTTVHEQLVTAVHELEGHLRAFETLEKRLLQPAAMSAPALDKTRSTVQIRLQKLRQELFRLREELRLDDKEAKLLARQKEMQKIREEEERKRQEEQLLQEAKAADQRRADFLALWSVRAQKLAASMNHGMGLGDVQLVRQCVRNSEMFQQEIRKGFLNIPQVPLPFATTGSATSGGFSQPPSNTSLGTALSGNPSSLQSPTTPHQNSTKQRGKSLAPNAAHASDFAVAESQRVFKQHSEQLEVLCRQLTDTGFLGQQYVERHEAALLLRNAGGLGSAPTMTTVSVNGFAARDSSPSNNSNKFSSGDTRPSNEITEEPTGPTEVPEELKLLISQHASKQVAEYIKANNSTLTLAQVRAVQALWESERTQRQWVQQLHSAIQTACALHNSVLLKAQIEAADQANFCDDYVLAAKEIYNNMSKQASTSAGAVTTKKEASSQPHEHINNHDNDENNEEPDPHNPLAEGGTSAAAVVIPTPIPKLLPLARTWNTGSRGTLDAALLELHSSITALLQSPPSLLAAGKLDCTKILVPEDVPEVRRVVDAWIQVFQHRVKPSGLFRKVERNIFDVFVFLGNVHKSGNYLAPYTNRLCGDFERVKRYNSPRGHSSAYVLMTYLLRRQDLPLILAEIDRVGVKELSDIFYDDALLRNLACQEELSRVCAEMTSQIEWPFVIEEGQGVTAVSIARALSQPAGGGGASTSLSPQRRGGAVSGSGDGATSGGGGELSNAARREADVTRVMALLRQSVATFSKYFAEELKRQTAGGGVSSSPSSAVDAATKSRQILDEGRNKSVGIIFREHICVALAAALGSGLKSYHLLTKRHVWDVIEALGERLREGARGIRAVGIPDAVDMVLGITDRQGRNRTALSRLSEEGIKDVRLRMFLSHCLNQKLLVAVFECLYEDELITHSSSHAEFVKKYYTLERCMMSPMTSESAVEVLRIVKKWNALPFVLAIDAEVW